MEKLVAIAFDANRLKNAVGNPYELDYKALKSSEWVYRLGFPKGDSYSLWEFIPVAKPASALRSLPCVALSSVAVKAFLIPQT